MTAHATVPERSTESLLEVTRRLLSEDARSLPEIHAQIYNQGFDIGYFWLRKVSCGEINDPSVNKIEVLYRFLMGMPVPETLK
jgi:hypothetical protein